MLAYSNSKYGPADVISKVEIPKPKARSNEILIKAIATNVSAGDWRARSLTMPKGLGFMGRLVFGLTGPRSCRFYKPTAKNR